MYVEGKTGDKHAKLGGTSLKLQPTNPRGCKERKKHDQNKNSSQEQRSKNGERMVYQKPDSSETMQALTGQG